MLQWIATVPPFDLALSRYSGVEIRYSNLTAVSTGGMYSTVHLPPVHPAVPTFRRMNWRQDDIFAKKKFRHIFLINREKNNIKIKKTLIIGVRPTCRQIGLRSCNRPNAVRGSQRKPANERKKNRVHFLGCNRLYPSAGAVLIRMLP